MPIQQIFLGAGGPAGEKYWYQKMDFTDYSSGPTNAGGSSGWTRYSVAVDSEENSYWLLGTQGSAQRGFLLGFDKDGANIIKSYGGNFDQGPSHSVSGTASFRPNGRTRSYIFNNKIYFVAQDSVFYPSGCFAVIDNISSGETPTSLNLAKYTSTGVEVNGTITTDFLVPNFPTEVDHSVDFDGHPDEIRIDNHNDFNFGNGDFTVECWIKSTQTTSGYFTALGPWTTHLSGRDYGWCIRYASQDIGTGWSFFYSTTGQNYVTTMGADISDGNWHHVAISRSGSNLRTFTDGVLNTTRSTTDTIYGPETTMKIGGQDTSANGFDGKISNVRITKGQALYTADFVPTLSPFTTTSQSATASSVKLLCCQSAADSATARSVSFDDSDDYLEAPSSTDFQMSGDFTIECFFKSSSVSNVNVILNGRGTSSDGGPVIYTNGTTLVFDNGTGTVCSLASAIETGRWYHVAGTRTGNTWRLFLDGTEVASGTDSTSYTAARGFVIGKSHHAGEFYGGLVSNVRVIKGQVIYPPISNSVDFDGSGDYLSQTLSDDLKLWHAQAFTVEYWVKGDAFASTQNGGSPVVGATTPTSGPEYWSFGPKSGGEVTFYYWNGSVTNLNSGYTLATDRWYHLAFVHDGSSNLNIFVDGSLVKTGTIEGTPTGTAEDLAVGQVASTAFNGKVSNLRITHQALYLDNYSVDFDGTDDYLSIPDHADYELGSNDFTLECWVNTSVTSSDYRNVFGKWQGSGQFSYMIRSSKPNPADGWVFFYSTTGSPGGHTIVESGVNVHDGQWHHLAVTRTGGKVRLFTDGNLSKEENITATIYNSTAPVVIASDQGDQWFTGKISNVRIVNGTAIYTSSFTVPTEPLTNITNTKLLCCNNSSVTGSTVCTGTITAGGGPTVSLLNPFVDDFTPSNTPLTTTSQGATGSNVKLLCCKGTTTTASDVTVNTISANGDPEVSTQNGFTYSVTEPLTTTSQGATASNVKLLCCQSSSVTGATVGSLSATGGPTASTLNPFDAALATVSPKPLRIFGDTFVAQDCEFSGSLLIGGKLKNSTYTSNANNRRPFFYKSPITVGNNTSNQSSKLFFHKRLDRTGGSAYAANSYFKDACISHDKTTGYAVGSWSDGAGLDQGESNIILCKFNYQTGANIANYSLGHSSYDSPTSIAIDSSDNLFIGGTTTQGSHPWWEYRCLITKVNSSGVIQWKKYIANSTTDQIRAIEDIVLDSSGNVYGIGQNTDSSNGAFFVFKMTSAGVLSWVTKITVNVNTNKIPYAAAIDIAGEDENLYFLFSYDMNPSGGTSSTYRSIAAGVKYPNDGSKTGTYGDLIFTSVTNFTASDASLTSVSASRVGYVDSAKDECSANPSDSYSNGNPTLTKVNL